MPEPTSAGGGYTCQVCGSTYASQTDLINHGRDQHPDRPVTWGDPREGSPRTASTQGEEPGRQQHIRQNVQDASDKLKAGAKAVGGKVSDPDRDLKTEYEQKRAEEKTT